MSASGDIVTQTGGVDKSMILCYNIYVKLNFNHNYMGETPSFNPEADSHNIAELAKNPLKASDEVQKLMRMGKYEEGNKLLQTILDAQQGKRGRDNEAPPQAMAA